jgi:hypothetical protein
MKNANNELIAYLRRETIPYLQGTKERSKLNERELVYRSKATKVYRVSKEIKLAIKELLFFIDGIEGGGMKSVQDCVDTVPTIRAAVTRVLKSYHKGHRFYGNIFVDQCKALIPSARFKYIDTFLCMMRRHCRFMYRCIDHNNSLYERI